jgi:Ca-activated chloride channel homolog
MSFLWAGSLFLLALIPIIIVVYILMLKRRKRYVIRYSSLSLVRDAVAHQSRFRRHVPFALFMLALASLVFALARPVATIVVPSNKAMIIMAMDVSRSMCSTDIPPNRLEAAKDAAQSFVNNEMSGRQVGIVAFAGFAELIQPPTNNMSSLQSAIESLTTARRTAIGSAILRSIDAIAEVDENVVPSDIGSSTPPPTPPSEYSPHIIVLLTDGASNAGPYPLSAAQQAAERGIRVYTIGFGTTNNSSAMDCGDQFQENDQFGGGFGLPFGGGGGGGFRRDIDEETLKQIAELTGGAYYAATSANELQNVLNNLPTYVITTRETTEVSVIFTAIATILAILAVILSLLWHPLP